MASVDDPGEFIARMFDMEIREGRGEHCQVSEAGLRPEGLDLAPGELVHGIYKGKYFFSPQALFIKAGNSTRRIDWSSVVACSTRHGDGNKTSRLTLTDQRLVEIRIADLATGWSGRISQLFHKMIEHWGHRAWSGLPLRSIGDYFDAAKDDYSFAPNLEPHPPLAELRSALLAMLDRPDVHQVLVSVLELEGDEPIANGVVVVAEPTASFDPLPDALRDFEVRPASGNTRRKLGVGDEARVLEIVAP
jgi:hypothetical protein